MTKHVISEDMTESLAIEQWQTSPHVNVEFDDYPRFDVESAARLDQKKKFINGEIYVPNFDYPKLDKLFDLPAIDLLPAADKKHIAQTAVFELSAAQSGNAKPDANLEMYTDFYEMRLKRMALVHNAWLLSHAGSSSALEIAQNRYMDLNVELFGPIDAPLARGMLHTEVDRANDFIPKNEHAAVIKEDLLSFFADSELSEAEPELMKSAELQRMKEFVTEKYADILAVIPDTGDDVYYDAEECREIMQRALGAGGLEEAGWKAEVTNKKSIVSTNVTTKTVFLPVSTRRNALALKKLTLHETEVHARRGQNGEASGHKMLKNGTADYADVEEGLGLILECAVDGVLGGTAITRARNRYITAGLALGVEGAPRDARQTFEVLWRMLALQQSRTGIIEQADITTAKEQAYEHIENAFRGTTYAAPGVIYTKLKVYYEGLKKNADFFAKNIDNLAEVFPIIMRGKYNHTDTEETERVDKLLAA